LPTAPASSAGSAFPQRAPDGRCEDTNVSEERERKNRPRAHFSSNRKSSMAASGCQCRHQCRKWLRSCVSRRWWKRRSGMFIAENSAAHPVRLPRNANCGWDRLDRREAAHPARPRKPPDNLQPEARHSRWEYSCRPAQSRPAAIRRCRHPRLNDEWISDAVSQLEQPLRRFWTGRYSWMMCADRFHWVLLRFGPYN
jgi:hypothetical protein